MRIFRIMGLMRIGIKGTSVSLQKEGVRSKAQGASEDKRAANNKEKSHLAVELYSALCREEERVEGGMGVSNARPKLHPCAFGKTAAGGWRIRSEVPR